MTGPEITSKELKNSARHPPDDIARKHLSSEELDPSNFKLDMERNKNRAIEKRPKNMN